jgi:hypothetical protein
MSNSRTTPHPRATPSSSTSRPDATATGSSPAGSPPHHALGRVAEALAPLALDPEAPTYAVGVVRPPGEDGGPEAGASALDAGELVVRALQRHPLDELLGFDAPAEWWAFGFTSRATAHRIDPGDESSRPVGVVHLVDRTGAAVGRLVRPDEPDLEVTGSLAGSLHDLCCRVLGAPSPAPTVTAAYYLAQSWLSLVLGRAARATTPLTWEQVVDAHPVAPMLCQLVPAMAAAKTATPPGVRSPKLPPTEAHALAAAGDVLARTLTWDDLRQGWAENHDEGHAGLDPHELRWMDAGMLSRWCCGLYAELDDLVDAVAAVLAAPVARRVIETLAAWDVPLGQGDRDRLLFSG